MLPLDVASLRAAVEHGQAFEYSFFYGHTPRPDDRLSNACPSQWWPCRFTRDGQAYTSSEQWIMASKAREFRDHATLAKILATHDPAEVKRLGREVQSFDSDRWDAVRFDLVTLGNVAKFGDDPGLREFLLSTEDLVLVEAPPRDQIDEENISIALGGDEAGIETLRTTSKYGAASYRRNE